MQIVLAAISAGGFIGVSNQYLCLLLIAVAANQRWLVVSPEVAFMGSGWFIAIVGLFWLVTVAPAYSALLLPGVMNTVNTLINFLSGFVVPASGTLLSLASVGIIGELHPDTQHMLQTLQIFNPEGGLSGSGLVVAGGGAAAATSLTFMKFLTKPALSTATGTVGTASAPIYATLENMASLVFMGLLYVLLNANPWLLVILFGITCLVSLALLIYGVYLLWKLGQGIGRLVRLLQTQPKAGWSVIAEFFIWGSGWFIWQTPTRGIVMMGLWLVAGFLWWVGFGLALLFPLLLVLYLPLTLLMFTFIGIYSARALLRRLDLPDEVLPGEVLGGMPSLGVG